MTPPAAPAFRQIKAQVAAIQAKRPEARLIGIRSRGRWEGEEYITDGDNRYRILQCDAPIQFRMALRENRNDLAATVFITPLDDRQIGEDIRLRLAGRKLYAIHAWRIIEWMFRARRIDPRITAHEWIADMLMELAPTAGYSPVPSGVLDAETVWEILLTRHLSMDTGAPDLIALLDWSTDPDHTERWRRSEDRFRQAVQDWIEQTAGPAGSAILRCVSANPEPLGLPVGLALGIFYAEEARGKLDKAAGRLEQLTGNPEIPAGIARRWHGAARDLVRAHRSDASFRRKWLSVSDEVLKRVGAAEFAYLSEVSPLGLEQRFARFGEALAQAVSRSPVRVDKPLLDARKSISAHEKLHREDEHRRTERVTMAVRLLRWLANVDARKNTPWGGFSDAVCDYARHGGFVDWARHCISGGEPCETLSRAYAKLGKAATRVREAQNRAFAELLRDWTRSGAKDGPILCIEHVIERIVAPLISETPVLLLLIDGMSQAVFQELLEDFTATGWTELAPSEGSDLPPVLATIPSVTKFSRASLFMGRLGEGGSTDEIKGLAEHPALKSGPSTPILFHKVDITDAEDGSLAEAVRKAVSDSAHRLVGVILNAVDDHLKKGEQTDPQWTVDYIRALPALLSEAGAAGRTVLLVSDHGHVLDRGTTLKPNGVGERWRTGAPPAEAGEVAVSGSRVMGDESQEIIGLWSEDFRYGMKKNGYHGGLSPQEMVVPMALLAPGDPIPAGWEGKARFVPAWWEEPTLVIQEVINPYQPRKPQSVLPKAGQLKLFQSEAPPPEKPAKPPRPKEETRAAASIPEWPDRLTASPVYLEQKSLAGRAVPDDTVMVQFLKALFLRGGRTTAAAVSRELSIPAFRLPGWIASAQRILNVEGYPILARDDAAETITLNIDLLKKQFELE